ncbi:MAG: metal ABC transporter solute-binding protein, Zn/Mn family [Bernardetiaceae bacterium]
MKTNLLFWLGLLGLLGACADPKPDTNAKKQLRLVCTTGIIADALQNIVGDRAEVIALISPGVDPHLFEPTQGDLQSLSSADVIFYNGLHLEGKMTDILQKIARKKNVVAFSDGLPATEIQKDDPHLWFDLGRWQKCVSFAARQLSTMDNKNVGFYLSNAQIYVRQIDSLHHWVAEQMQLIPKTQRVLITAHDAFGYFGTAYDIEVKALQGISTLSEYGLRDVRELTDFIIDRQIKAVFVESSVSERSLAAVVSGCQERGHQVRIGGTLYSDALDAPGTSAGTYLGMVRTNVKTIRDGLK